MVIVMKRLRKGEWRQPPCIPRIIRSIKVSISDKMVEYIRQITNPELYTHWNKESEQKEFPTNRP